MNKKILNKEGAASLLTYHFPFLLRLDIPFGILNQFID